MQNVAGKAYSQVFHHSFKELDLCARKCVTCCIFRQSLLLQQISVGEIETLYEDGDRDAVSATLYSSKSFPEQTRGLVIRIGSVKGSSTLPRRSVLLVVVDAKGPRPIPNAVKLCFDPMDGRIFREVRGWLINCVTNHPACRSLRWSDRAPTRLIRIISSSQLRLERSIPDGTAYMALSYCWGTDGDGGKTTKKNLDQRYQSFSRIELPATIQDAITFAEKIGLQYLWIDRLCIIQGDGVDWQDESARMHEVYCNAHLTLCVSSNDTAASPLFQHRQAWSIPTPPSMLNNYFVSSTSLSLHQIRQSSPLSKRAWTLQEEQLSPRILYWTSQRMYWSCAQSAHSEKAKPQICDGPEISLLNACTTVAASPKIL